MKDDDRIWYEKTVGAERKLWGEGPWSNEPDRVEWRHCGLPCLMLRGDGGAWCGYVGVPPGHPLYDKPDASDDLAAHGGINFTARCRGAICHVPEPGEPEDVFWFGFDCAHARDRKPIESSPLFAAFPLAGVRVYRAVAFVKREVERLAEQIKERG